MTRKKPSPARIPGAIVSPEAARPAASTRSHPGSQRKGPSAEGYQALAQGGEVFMMFRGTDERRACLMRWVTNPRPWSRCPLQKRRSWICIRRAKMPRQDFINLPGHEDPT